MILTQYRNIARRAYERYTPIRERKARAHLNRKKDYNLPYKSNSISISSLADDFKKAGLISTDTIFIRTSLAAASSFEGGCSSYIKALMDFFQDGNIVMSSYTFNKSPLMFLSENPLFDPAHSVDQLNLVSEFFRRNQNVYRSIHPTHSIVAWGKDAKWIVKDHHKSEFCYGPNSPFARLYDLNAKEISVGVFPTSLTYHYIEQFIPKDQPSFRDLPSPIMCRILLDGKECLMPFCATDTFASILRVSEVFEGTGAEPVHHKISEYLDFYTTNLTDQLTALKKIVKEKGSLHYITNRWKHFFKKNIIRPMVLKAFFNKKNGILYPAKEPSK